jgi:hypothetical protein
VLLASGLQSFSRKGELSTQDRHHSHTGPALDYAAPALADPFTVRFQPLVPGRPDLEADKRTKRGYWDLFWHGNGREMIAHSLKVASQPTTRRLCGDARNAIASVSRTGDLAQADTALMGDFWLQSTRQSTQRRRSFRPNQRGNARACDGTAASLGIGSRP